MYSPLMLAAMVLLTSSVALAGAPVRNGPSDLVYPGQIGGPAVQHTIVPNPWGPNQPDPSPVETVPPATLTICPQEGPGCANFPYYPYGQADANNQLVTPGYVAYVQPGTYDIPGFAVQNAAECWYIGMGKAPTDTVIHVTSLVQGKAAVLIQSPCHFVNMTIENGDLNTFGSFGEGGVAGTYVTGLPQPAQGQLVSTVTFDRMRFAGNNNGLFSPPIEYDPSARWTQLVVRNSEFDNNSVYGGGGSHDLYVGAWYLTLKSDVFWGNTDSDDAKSRGAYVYSENMFAIAWAGRCLDRPNGGVTVTIYDVCWLQNSLPYPQRGVPPADTGNHLYANGEDGTSDGAIVLGVPNTWTDMSGTIITGSLGQQSAGHCSQLMTRTGSSIAFVNLTVYWTDPTGCIVLDAPYGASPGTVTGVPALAPPANAPIYDFDYILSYVPSYP